jgi:uncharacterized protein (DUF697 family)
MDYTKEILSVIFYPVKSSGLTAAQREIIDGIFSNITDDEIETVLKEKISSVELAGFAEKIEDKDKLFVFQTSKLILDKNGISIDQIELLSEIGKALDVKEGETGFTFNLYNPDDIRDYDFDRTLTNFSIVASAIGFIPFIPFADFFILAPIQIGMVSKIANIYKFNINSKEFIKLITGTLGAGLLFKLTASILNSFIPFIGWIINASVAFAGTYAIGIITRRYIEADGELSPENIREIWAKSFEDGKKEFSKLKEYILLRKHELRDEIKRYMDENRENSYEDDVADNGSFIAPDNDNKTGQSEKVSRKKKRNL